MSVPLSEVIWDQLVIYLALGSNFDLMHLLGRYAFFNLFFFFKLQTSNWKIGIRKIESQLCVLRMRCGGLERGLAIT